MESRVSIENGLEHLAVLNCQNKNPAKSHFREQWHGRNLATNVMKEKNSASPQNPDSISTPPLSIGNKRMKVPKLKQGSA